MAVSRMLYTRVKRYKKVKKRKLTAAFENYTAKDLYDFWCNEFLNENQSEYTSRGFIGNELHLLKQILEECDIYAILLAISSGIKAGEIAIKYFVESLSEYLPSTQYAKYVFLVKESNNLKAKELLDRLLFLECKWIPSGDDNAKKNSIIDELNTLLG